MSDEWEGPDGGDLNELERDAAYAEATLDGSHGYHLDVVCACDPDPAYCDQPCHCPCHFEPGARVMWNHGHGVAGTVRPRDEWPHADQLDAHPDSAFVEWDDGATTLVVPTALTPSSGAGPTPYPDDFGTDAPF